MKMIIKFLPILAIVALGLGVEACSDANAAAPTSGDYHREDGQWYFKSNVNIDGTLDNPQILKATTAATATAINVTRSHSIAITQNGAETNTLAIPTFRGQRLVLFVDTDTSGARVVTSAQRINQAGNTIITMTDVGDYIELQAITIAGALRWQVVANDGCVLS